MIPKNTWVQIHRIVLKPEERPISLPEETRRVPLELWIKGFLLEDASLQDEVTVRTLTGRLECGTLVQMNPSYLHTYGAFVPEILQIDRIVKEALYGSGTNE